MPRRNNDYYPTPTSLTKSLLEHYHIDGSVLEICSGNNDIADVLINNGLTVITNDIDKSMPANYHYDATDESVVVNNLPDIDYICTNPPFNQAEKIIPLAFNKAKKGIIMLLRSTYMEPTFSRQQWLKSHEEYLSHIIFCPRISFTGDGKTDSTSCNWFCWTKEKVVGTKCIWITK